MDLITAKAMLTIEELAAALRISVRHVQRMQADGLPYTPVGKRGKRYDLEACKAWLREHYTCRSSPQKRGAGMSPSASTTRAYIDDCRRVQLRVMPAP